VSAAPSVPCNDGWQSPSPGGPGTCSHHGGEAGGGGLLSGDDSSSSGATWRWLTVPQVLVCVYGPILLLLGWVWSKRRGRGERRHESSARPGQPPAG
jgi:hypothetical protein